MLPLMAAIMRGRLVLRVARIHLGLPGVHEGREGVARLQLQGDRQAHLAFGVARVRIKTAPQQCRNGVAIIAADGGEEIIVRTRPRQGHCDHGHGAQHRGKQAATPRVHARTPLEQRVEIAAGGLGHRLYRHIACLRDLLGNQGDKRGVVRLAAIRHRCQIGAVGFR